MKRDECKTCGGEGAITVDCFSPGRDHYTVEEPCPDCHEDYDDREPEDLGPLERGMPALGNQAPDRR